jgi:surface antigen
MVVAGMVLSLGAMTAPAGAATIGSWPGTGGPKAANTQYGYPYPNAPQCTDGGACVNDKWDFDQGQCTSWAAYRLNQLNGFAFTDYYGGQTWGNAGNWGVAAQSLKIPVDGTPAVGSIAWYANSPGNDDGHVAYVEQVNSPTSVVISEMNYDFDNGFRVRTITTSSGWPTDFIHFPGGGASSGGGPGPAPPAPGEPVPGEPGTSTNGSTISIPGRWVAGDSGQDFAYVTKGANDGFDVAVWEQTPSGLKWQGVWWSEDGSTGVTFENTVLIPVVNSAGLMNLYYATSTDWQKPGFSLALMRNTGHGFQYAGQQWDPTTLKLGQTRFIPGTWSTAGPGFAYITENADNGFTVASFTASSSGLQWNGVSWTEAGSTGVQYGNTEFIPINADGNRLTDLFYATSTNWGNPGFTLGEMQNTGGGLQYTGTAWQASGLKLSQIQFLPGYWTGGSREGLGYVTPNGDSGFSFAVFASTPSGLQWQGVWWTEPGSTGVLYANTVFAPADVFATGRTDLYYATSADPSNLGFALALMQNNSGTGLAYQGQQWDDSGLSLSGIEFLPDV